ncbi:MAG: hypothetical protein V3V14_09240 [Saprospiraceae bacterium]
MKFIFKLSTLSNDFTAIDANGQMVAYVKQKMFKLKEDIRIFSDESMTDQVNSISANKWIDFSAAYSFFDREGVEIGKIARKGWASIWKAKYEIFDNSQEHQYTIREEKGWVKVFDSVLGEIPILGFFTGYLFNPSYIVKDNDGNEIARLKKEASFWGRKFEVEKLGQLKDDDDERIILGLMMMVLLERRRG